VKNKKKKKILRDKNGCEFIKQYFFVGGKMKFRKIHVIDGIPSDEFYEKNASDIDFYLNGDYELMNNEKDSNNNFSKQNNKEPGSLDNADLKDLPS
jgi:putative NIF3 family GTP cyclohydrolase 1 type 2